MYPIFFWGDIVKLSPCAYDQTILPCGNSGSYSNAYNYILVATSKKYIPPVFTRIKSPETRMETGRSQITRNGFIPKIEAATKEFFAI